MAHPRCIVEKLPAVGDIAWLSKDEAKHAMGSRRLEAGDSLELVDGRGGVALSNILPTRNAAGETGAKVSAELPPKWRRSGAEVTPNGRRSGAEVAPK